MCFLSGLGPRAKILQMPINIAHIAKAAQANAETKALSKSAISLPFIVSLVLSGISS